jgi:hypothetical protein
MAGCGKVKKMEEGGRVKKTNELKGEAKEKARKTFAGEKKGLSGRLSNFMKGVKERKAAADKKISDRAKAKRDQVKGKAKPVPKPAPKAVDKGGRSAAPGSQGFKPTNTKMSPNMSKVNKPDVKRDKTARDAMPKKKEEKMDRRALGRALQRKAQASMGFKKGGKVDGCAVRGKTKGKMC